MNYCHVVGRYITNGTSLSGGPTSPVLSDANIPPLYPEKLLFIQHLTDESPARRGITHNSCCHRGAVFLPLIFSFLSYLSCFKNLIRKHSWHGCHTLRGLQQRRIYPTHRRMSAGLSIICSITKMALIRAMPAQTPQSSKTLLRTVACDKVRVRTTFGHAPFNELYNEHTLKETTGNDPK